MIQAGPSGSNSNGGKYNLRRRRATDLQTKEEKKETKPVVPVKRRRKLAAVNPALVPTGEYYFN